MPAHPTTRPCRRRLRRVLALLAALTALVALTLPASGAAAGPGTTISSASPDRITLDNVGFVLPAASGSPDVLVSADKPFSLTVTFRAGNLPAPYSNGTGTDVKVTVNGGKTLTTATVPAGKTSVTVSGLWLADANGVTLTAQAVGRRAAADLRPGTAGPFDVALTAENVPIPPAQRGASLFVTSTGSAEPCEATARQQTCVDVLLPNGVNSDVVFSTGFCTGVQNCLVRDMLVLQVLADLEDARDRPLYGPDAPATLIVRCDKSKCGGGAIQSNTLQVNLDPVGHLKASPACSAKGYMSGPDGHCVDYVQSKRDGSGDTYLYLLITRDARMSW